MYLKIASQVLFLIWHLSDIAVKPPSTHKIHKQIKNKCKVLLYNSSNCAVKEDKIVLQNPKGLRENKENAKI